MDDPKASGGDVFAELYRRLDEAERALAHDVEASAERRRSLLAERARALGAVRSEATGHREDVVAFLVAGERFGLPTTAVDQVLDLKELAPLPGAPPGIAGMIAARSRVVPVLDPRPLLGLSGGGMSDLTQGIVVASAGAAFALAVERVEGRLEAPAAAGPSSLAGPFVRITGDGLPILDVARLIAALPGAR